MSLAPIVLQAIQAVCPLAGVSIGNPADPQTWRLDFAGQATPEQRDAATALLATFDQVWAARQLRLAALAERRFAEETRGIVLQGTALKTDRESQQQIDALQRSLADGTIESVKFKTASGAIVDCDLAMAMGLRAVVVLHVQACRTREAELAEALADATTLEDVAAVDIGAGWPA